MKVIIGLVVFAVVAYFVPPAIFGALISGVALGAFVLHLVEGPR